MPMTSKHNPQKFKTKTKTTKFFLENEFIGFMN